MNDTMTTVFSLTLSGSALTLALIALKPLLKSRISKAAQYYIWLLVLLRLVLPFTFDGSAMNQLFMQTAALPSMASHANAPEQEASIPQGSEQNPLQQNASSGVPSAPVLPDTNTQGSNPATTIPVETPFDFWAFVEEHQVVIWLSGAVLYFGWFFIPYLRFTRRIRKTCVQPHPADTEVFKSLRGGARVRLSCNPYIDTPMLVGLFSPCIVIPQLAFIKNGMRQELQHILQHELAHYRRRDLLYKWFAVMVSSLHWFNPLMILMRREINRACELSCDEAVIRSLDAAGRQRYGDTLLGLAASRRFPSGIVMTTMCEEKRELKERLVSIMVYKKITPVMIALSLSMVLLLAGCGAALGAALGKDNATAPTFIISSSDPLEQAVELIEQKRYPQAMGILSKLTEDPDAQALLTQLRYIVNGTYIRADAFAVAAITQDGGLRIAGKWDGYEDSHKILSEAQKWQNISSISDLSYGATIAALTQQGDILLSSTWNTDELLNSGVATDIKMAELTQYVATWNNLAAYETFYPESAVGLTAAGEVYVAYPTGEGFIGKLDWKDIVAVADGRSYALGLKSDGVVLSVFYNMSTPVDVSEWRDIVAIDASWSAVGLRSDGTVVTADSGLVTTDTSDWGDIIAVSTYERSTLGLKSDGTVVATGDNRYGQLNVSDWTDIVAIDTSAYLSIGLKSDGTMVIAGDSSDGGVATPDVSSMSGLFVPVASRSINLGNEESQSQTADYDGNFTKWTDKLSIRGDLDIKPAQFSGIQINGTRQGVIGLEYLGAYETVHRNRITLFENGRELGAAEFLFVTKDPWIDIQCADLDQDGTDEIIVSAVIATGPGNDIRIFSYDGKQFQEVLTIYTTAAYASYAPDETTVKEYEQRLGKDPAKVLELYECIRCQPVQTEDGSYRLQVVSAEQGGDWIDEYVFNGLSWTKVDDDTRQLLPPSTIRK